MATPQYDPRNQLLGLLPEEELARLLPHLELVELPLGKSLSESGGVMEYVYFPLDAIVSLLCVMKDGASSDITVWAVKGSLTCHCSWVASPCSDGIDCVR